jgi:hypothetical protein
MLIDYGINRKIGKKIEHKNKQINLPEVCDANWEVSHVYIINKLYEANTGWNITGYAMHITPPEPPND